MRTRSFKDGIFVVVRMLDGMALGADGVKKERCHWE
jgi:hypothetical protein